MIYTTVYIWVNKQLMILKKNITGNSSPLRVLPSDKIELLRALLPELEDNVKHFDCHIYIKKFH